MTSGSPCGEVGQVEDVAASFRRLRMLLADCAGSSSKHDQVIVLIAACIEEGFATGTRITGALATLGFNKRHVGKMLTELAKPGDGQWWYRSEEGDYRLRPVALSPVERQEA